MEIDVLDWRMKMGRAKNGAEREGILGVEPYGGDRKQNGFPEIDELELAFIIINHEKRLRLTKSF